jgi:hypothetical protein
MQYLIRLRNGAEIVGQDTGEVGQSACRNVVATRDENSGCMVFRTPLGVFYVQDADEYSIIREVTEERR